MFFFLAKVGSRRRRTFSKIELDYSRKAGLMPRARDTKTQYGAKEHLRPHPPTLCPLIIRQLPQSANPSFGRAAPPAFFKKTSPPPSRASHEPSQATPSQETVATSAARLQWRCRTGCALRASRSPGSTLARANRVRPHQGSTSGIPWTSWPRYATSRREEDACPSVRSR